MIQVEVTGVLQEVLYTSDKSCKFIIGDENKNLLCTITKRCMDLTDTISPGETYKIKGSIKAYTKINEKGRFTDNVFYVNDIKKHEKGVIECCTQPNISMQD